MKIIKRGNFIKPLEATVTCQRCECVFRFAASEARRVVDTRDGDAYVVKCPEPECRADNWVSVDLFK